MDYQVFDLVQPYIDKSHLIFASLVCKDWLNIIKIINKKTYSTPYKTLTSPTLLSYADQYLNLAYDEKVKETIIKMGNPESIKYLHTKTDILDGVYFNYAVENGLLDAMKCLLEIGCEFCDFTFNIAALHGNLDNMKWLKDNGCEFGEQTFAHAAKHGNLDNMKWLLDKGTQFSFDTFACATSKGILDNMKWLKSNGCQFDDYTFIEAIYNGSKENVQWLLDNGCPH